MNSPPLTKSVSDNRLFLTVLQVMGRIKPHMQPVRLQRLHESLD